MIAFLRIDGVLGSCDSPEHLGEIEVVSWSWRTPDKRKAGSRAARNDKTPVGIDFATTDAMVASLLNSAKMNGLRYSNVQLNQFKTIGQNEIRVLSVAMKRVVVEDCTFRGIRGNQMIFEYRLSYEDVLTMPNVLP
jgi:type VI protein secretion system component Hcp